MSLKQYASFNSYSGADIVASINLNGKNRVFGEIQTLTYSIHREKGQVRALGHTNVKGFTYGPRTIAGSLIFTVFDRHVMDTFKKQMLHDLPDKLTAGNFITDELPPFDITITFANEYGHMSRLAIYGVTIVDEGQTMSVDDMMTENIMSYMARDIELMTAMGDGLWAMGD